MDQIDVILHVLERACFPHPVAIRSGDDPELGAILEADAFDVPDGDVLAAHESLANLLWPCAFVPIVVLPGSLDPSESARTRQQLPEGTVWYVPEPTSRSSTP